MAELPVRLTPRAHHDAVALRDGVVQARVRAPPVDGRANEALRRALARALDVAPSRVTIVRGHTARDKIVRVEGLTTDEATSRLA